MDSVLNAARARRYLATGEVDGKGARARWLIERATASVAADAARALVESVCGAVRNQIRHG